MARREGSGKTLVAFTIHALLALAVVVHLGMMRSAQGAVLRWVGGNPRWTGKSK